MVQRGEGTKEPWGTLGKLGEYKGRMDPPPYGHHHVKELELGCRMMGRG